MGRLAGLWGLTGVALLFTYAIVRLGRRGVETVLSGMTPLQWGLLALSLVLFGLGEGVLALQKHWVPRVIERAKALGGGAARLHRALAPMYVMELMGTTPRGLVRGWGLAIGIALLAFSVQLLPDPWRGIIDLGVAAALGWALLFIVAGAIRLLGASRGR